MIQSKEEFIRSFLPDEVENIELTQINMDITDYAFSINWNTFIYHT